jgi:hypothetical protein
MHINIFWLLSNSSTVCWRQTIPFRLILNNLGDKMQLIMGGMICVILCLAILSIVLWAELQELRETPEEKMMEENNG